MQDVTKYYLKQDNLRELPAIAYADHLDIGGKYGAAYLKKSVDEKSQSRLGLVPAIPLVTGPERVAYTFPQDAITEPDSIYLFSLGTSLTLLPPKDGTTLCLLTTRIHLDETISGQLPLEAYPKEELPNLREQQAAFCQEMQKRREAVQKLGSVKSRTPYERYCYEYRKADAISPFTQDLLALDAVISAGLLQPKDVEQTVLAYSPNLQASAGAYFPDPSYAKGIARYLQQEHPEKQAEHGKKEAGKGDAR